MRKALILLLANFILFSCSNEKTEFSLKGKWVILDFKKNDVDVINKLNKEIPSLSYYLNDRYAYPAIRFKDSIIVIPGNKNRVFRLRFEVDSNLEEIKIKKLEESENDTIPQFIENSFLKTFEIIKNTKRKSLTLKSRDETITIIDSEIFSNQVNSRFMD